MVFSWDEENIEHIALHNVEPFEAEDALMDPQRVKFFAHSGNSGINDATESETKIYNRRNR